MVTLPVQRHFALQTFTPTTETSGSRRRFITAGGNFLFYLHDEPSCLRFTLIADLDGEELRDFEGSLRTAESTRRGRALIVDITRLASVDQKTQALLSDLRNAGASIIANGNHSRRRRYSGG